MKTKLFFFIFSILSLNIIAQAPIGFEDHLVADDYNSGAIYADLDGDSDMDIVLSSDTNYANGPFAAFSTTWLENLDGQGHFGEPKIIDNNTPTAVIPVFHASDLDADGDMDVIGSHVGEFFWYENLDGQGSFGSKQVIDNVANGIRPTISTSDMDGDSDEDILAVGIMNGNAETISWYENNGQGIFGAQQIITSLPPAFYYVSANDLDNDGDKDILAALDSGQKIAWFENLGQGNFSGSVKEVMDDVGANNVFEFFEFISVEDMDNDGDIDVVANKGLTPPEEMVWYENDGVGNFGSSQTLISTATYIEFSLANDYDMDGDIDLLTTEPNVGPLDKIMFYENTGQLNFAPAQNIGNVGFAFIFEDMEGDGDEDLLWSSYGSICWNENLNGQGNFGNNQVAYTPVSFNPADLGDMDGDGDLDIVSGTSGLAWFENLNGQGFFVPKNIISVEAHFFSLAQLSDLDVDGDMDVLAFSENGVVVWHENLNGQGDFGPEQVLMLATNNDPMAGYTPQVSLGDLDNDGDEDLLSAIQSTTKLAWRENIGGNFGPEQVVSTNVNVTTPFYVADIDGDTDMDVLCADVHKIVWYENSDGQGSFGTQQIISSLSMSGELNSIYPKDMDADGDQDIIVTSVDEIVWYENSNGQGSFGSPQYISTSAMGATSVHGSDIDNDGDVDVLSGSSINNQLLWYENTGNQNFNPPSVIGNDSTFGTKFILTKDINGDNKQDILASSYDGLAWYENLGVLSNNNIDFGKEDTVIIYPNPTSGILNIHNRNAAVTKIKLYNHLGQELIEVQGKKGIEAIDLQNISPGIYFVKLMDAQGNSFVRKVVKN